MFRLQLICTCSLEKSLFVYSCSRTDLPLKNFNGDVLLITGASGAYANVVEKLYKDLDKKQTTLLKIEKASDVLSEYVSSYIRYMCIKAMHIGRTNQFYWS